MYHTPYELAGSTARIKKQTGKAGWYDQGDLEILKALNEKKAKIGTSNTDYPQILCSLGLHKMRRHHTFDYPAWWTANQSMDTGVFICTRPGCTKSYIKDLTCYNAP